MLVLSRQVDEAVMIGDDIRVTVVRIQHGKVRLGIDAPKALPVHRKEIYDRVQKERSA
jgi:carbon storage regulator